MNNEPNYYAVIPADIRYNKNLTPNAKLLYGEITSLCQKEGYCWATNKYFQELYGVSQPTVSEWVKELVDIHAITIEIDRKNNRRYIRLLIGGIKENLYTPLKENFYHNNINKNIINNNNNKKILIDEYFNFGDCEDVRDIANEYDERVLNSLYKFLMGTFMGQRVDVDWIRKQAERFANGNQG